MLKKLASKLGIKKKKYSEQKELSIATLQKLCSQRSPATVKFKGYTEQFMTMIIEVTGERILLDEFVPSKGNDAALSGNAFRFTSNDNGIAVTFKSQVIGDEIQHGNKVYHIAFPEDIGYLQRRDSYRIKLSAAVDRTIKCNYSGRELELKIKDVSSSGIAFICSEDDEDIFSVRDIIHGCELEISDDESIIFDFMVYRLKPLSKHINVSGRIIYKSNEQRAALTKYISKLDRELRRKDSQYKQNDLDIELLNSFDNNNAPK
ncbi:MAG: hypothetical protein HON32_06415 [Francisellaceae bacterium]|nr:hypothetical protein [Francisellaceae bacterium]MBT6539550.1 hypothetical protein [Francisellaceae bacterium]